MELFLNDKLGKITIEIAEAKEANAILIMAHGAGAGMQHPFMISLANNITDLGISTIRFNFPYMEQGRRSPGSPQANIETWKLIVEHTFSLYPNLPIFISGKSYGGRMASHLLSEKLVKDVSGIIYFGFPLHAPGKDSKDRASHLSNISSPQLFLQGTNDKLANIDLIREVVNELSTAELISFEYADHSFNVPKKSGKTKDQIMQELVDVTTKWVKDKIND